MNHVDKRQGFTLIELMLAMTFIAILLLAIAMTIIQIGTIYNRGLTLKEVNQSARTMGDELTRGISSSEAFSMTTKYIEIKDGTTTVGGRLCLGQFSYIWNFAEPFQKKTTGITHYVSDTDTRDLRFIKVPDATGIYCAWNTDHSAMFYRNIQSSDVAKASDLLKAGDRNLGLHKFTVTSLAGAKDANTGQQLYTVDFTIGTDTILALTPDKSACLPPGELNSDFSYCTIQQFTLVARAGDRVN